MEGAGVKSFEELRVFQEARALANRVLALAKQCAFAKEYFLKDQLCRSAVSVVSNIAEGFERQSRADFIRILFIAKASCGELRAQLLLASDQKLIDEKTHGELTAASKKVSIGLFRLIEYLRRKEGSCTN